MFCGDPDAEDRLENIMKRPRIQSVLPQRLKTSSLGKVWVRTWFLFGRRRSQRNEELQYTALMFPELLIGSNWKDL